MIETYLNEAVYGHPSGCLFYATNRVRIERWWYAESQKPKTGRGI